MSGPPIIFGATSIRAILAGTKTQTRRIAKPARGLTVHDLIANGERIMTETESGFMCSRDQLAPCRFEVGDRLWVREAFAWPNDQVTIYRANWRQDAEARGMDNIPSNDSEIRWRSPLFMPRKLSRITLEITDIRVERLQEISEADALAEGCVPGDFDDIGTPKAIFAALWEHINGSGAWDENPWVWALTFRRVER